MTFLAIIGVGMLIFALAILIDTLFVIKPLRRAWRKWWGAN